MERDRWSWGTSSTPVRDRLLLYAQLSVGMAAVVVVFGLSVRVSDTLARLVFG